MDEDLKQEVFYYLDALRESGETNMFGAGPYVQEEFGLSKKESRAVVGDWMRTYSERHGKEE